jgi:magnesium-transporting ATPase (P-type)
VEEAALTGESVPVEKDADERLKGDKDWVTRLIAAL